MPRRSATDLMELPPTPECDKAHKVHEESQAQGELLDWLQTEKGVNLMVWRDDVSSTTPCWGRDGNLDCDNGKTRRGEPCPGCDGRGYRDITVSGWVHLGGSINQLLAEFHGIDYDEMEREKKRVLQYVREQQGL